MTKDSRDSVIRFSDLSSMRSELEAIDVENGECWAWQFDGASIKLVVHMGAIATGAFIADEAQPPLSDVLRNAADEVGLSSDLAASDYSSTYDAIEQQYARTHKKRWFEFGPLWLPTRMIRRE